jgi:hypothetical protein
LTGMPRFHFHLQEDNRLIEDEIGLEISDEASARAQAMQAACAMARDLFVNSEAQRLVVDLRQDGGSPVVKIIIALVVEEP